MAAKVEIMKTGDGSCTLFIPDLNETYHSVHGALEESLYVYIRNGFDKMKERPVLNILEIGFGTGLNALLTLGHVNPRQEVRYFSLEPFPLEEQMLKEYYAGFRDSPAGLSFLDTLLKAPTGILTPVTDTFSFCLITKKLEELNSHDLNGNTVDLVYYDAFGPSRQPEMWTQPVLKKAVDAMGDHSLLVTYCAQGQFKRHLKSMGMEVENPPGALGKREMTVARRSYKL